MKYIGLTRPSYPLYAIFERTYSGYCDFETNIQEKDALSRVCFDCDGLFVIAISTIVSKFIVIIKIRNVNLDSINSEQFEKNNRNET